MGRTSTKENKNSYQLAREELGLTREKASELLETIAPERIEKIENERTVPRPDEVLTMAEKYKRPYRMCDSTVIYEIAKILNINLTMIETGFSANPSYHQIIAE